jgi:threonine dehydrogenase-like Zn-dependent dehydrogenase
MMRAVIMRGGEISTEDVTEPTPGPGQVLIAPHAAGICGSDLHAREVLTELAAADPHTPPMAIIPGHEFAGHIVAIGADTAADLNVGDLVTSIPFTPGPAGPETIGLSPNFGGGLAELTVADATRTFRLPDGVDARLGALSEPVAVAVHAYNLAAADGPVVIIGAGPIGQGVIAVASVNGRHPIIVVEPAPQRRATALRVGADTAHEPGVPLLELLAAVGYTPSTMSPLLDGEPRSVTIFECVGRANVVQSILAEALHTAGSSWPGPATHRSKSTHCNSPPRRSA